MDSMDFFKPFSSYDYKIEKDELFSDESFDDDDLVDFEDDEFHDIDESQFSNNSFVK